MTQKLTLQVALMTLIASALSIVLVAVGGGLSSAAVDLGQVVPLAVACAAAFIVIIVNPFERPSH